MHVKRWMIFFVIYAILGSAPTYSSQDKYRKIKKNQALINDVYRYIVANYVDEIDLDAFTKMSIDNMLMDLDPYTVFLEREEKSGIEMLTKGKYIRDDISCCGASFSQSYPFDPNGYACSYIYIYIFMYIYDTRI